MSLEDTIQGLTDAVKKFSEENLKANATARTSFTTVNGVKANGGSMDGPGPVMLPELA